MTDSKIDRVKLNQMLTSGKSGKDCAKYFNVTPGAISQAKKELNLAVVKSISIERAHQVIDKNLNAIDQLQKINSNANEILDSLMRWNQGDSKALQVLEAHVRKEGSKGEKVTEKKFRDPRELALKACGEIRNQLSLQLDIFKTMYDMAAVADFQREVLTIIGEVDLSLRDEIIKRLQKARALRSATHIS